MSAITLRLSESTSALLEEMASRLDRSQDDLIEQAVRGFLTGEADMMAEVEAGIADADHGRFASEERLSHVIGKFGVTLDR